MLNHHQSPNQSFVQMNPVKGVKDDTAVMETIFSDDMRLVQKIDLGSADVFVVERRSTKERLLAVLSSSGTGLLLPITQLLALC
jgi:hypothetical protein